MGLFTPKITPQQKLHVNMLLDRARECSELVNSTTKPDIFFSKLNLCIDTLLELQEFEKYKIFDKNRLPSKDLNKLAENIETIVDAFINRSYNKQLEKISSLKTDKAKFNSMCKYTKSMIDAFQNANNFYKGRNSKYHYNYVLYAPNNFKKLKELLKEYL